MTLLYAASAEAGVSHPYSDPLVNASTTFQQRVGQMMSLEAETRRWERNMAIAAAAATRLKRKTPATTSTALARDS